MKEESQRWLKAGSLISRDPKSIVKCPKCQKVNLDVEDIRADSNPELIERYMRCSSCGAWNVLRIRRPIDEK